MLDSHYPFAPRGAAFLRDREAAVLAAVQHFVLRYRARLALACRRLAGDDGAALSDAFRDMVLDDSTTPQCWPIGDLIDLLSSANPDTDGQVARMLSTLIGLAGAIDGLAHPPAGHMTRKTSRAA